MEDRNTVKPKIPSGRERPDNDGSLSPDEYESMRVNLQGAQPLWEEDCYVLRNRGKIIATGATVKQCYWRYIGWRI